MNNTTQSIYPMQITQQGNPIAYNKALANYTLNTEPVGGGTFIPLAQLAYRRGGRFENKNIYQSGGRVTNYYQKGALTISPVNHSQYYENMAVTDNNGKIVDLKMPTDINGRYWSQRIFDVWRKAKHPGFAGGTTLDRYRTEFKKLSNEAKWNAYRKYVSEKQAQQDVRRARWANIQSVPNTNLDGSPQSGFVNNSPQQINVAGTRQPGLTSDAGEIEGGSIIAKRPTRPAPTPTPTPTPTPRTPLAPMPAGPAITAPGLTPGDTGLAEGTPTEGTAPEGIALNKRQARRTWNNKKITLHPRQGQGNGRTQLEQWRGYGYWNAPRGGTVQVSPTEAAQNVPGLA